MEDCHDVYGQTHPEGLGFNSHSAMTQRMFVKKSPAAARMESARRTPPVAGISPALWLALFLNASIHAPAQVVPSDHSKHMAAGMELFNASVANVLKEHCLECHGGGKIKGDFDLATREGLLKGGAEGHVIEPGNAKASRLVKMISHQMQPSMPEKRQKLPQSAIDDISRWIDFGAPYTQPLVENARMVKDRSKVSDADRQFWAFQPLQPITPPRVSGMRQRSWVRTDVDKFIITELAKKKLHPNPAIDPRKLIRRAYFDLIGLPPTPEQVESFVRDRSPKAYERLVDELLASPHHGERWGRHWLDLARYGESHGYEQDYDRPHAHPYRDFVIRALNEDLPFHTFVRWQIAGDQLAPDNPQAWFATGFLGAGTHATQITANQAEKERYDELDDKINTIGTAMLGLTIGCARCHDHKFDPIPSVDYYSLISVFTRTVRSDHDVELNPEEARQSSKSFEAAHQPLVDRLRAFEKETLPARFERWLQSRPSPALPTWLTLRLEGVKASGGYYGINSTRKLEDESWLVAITAGTPDRITFTSKLPMPKGASASALTNLSAVRLEAIPDKSLPNWGPGWGKDGEFDLKSITLTAKPSGAKDGTQTIRLTPVKPPEESLWKSSKSAGGWTAQVFASDRPFGFPGGTELTFALHFNGGLKLPGRFRASVGTSAAAPAELPSFAVADDYAEAVHALGLPSGERTPAHSLALLKTFKALDEGWLKLANAVELHARTAPRPAVQKALVCSEGLPAIRLHTQGPDFYEETYQLRRGDLAQKQEVATPGFLQVLMRAGANAPARAGKPAPPASASSQRAALADWITDVEHGAGGLLARVIVNRMWQHHFGRGIVTTPSDFGATGAPPTHPELLDWLARELITHNWSLKHLHRLIMTSAVYMQDCSTDAKRPAVDPDNKLWWRREPMRLEAEPLRDAILAVSGRLDRTMFGPGSLDEGMPRRSIYFFIKRSKLIPWMTQFDWPDSLQGMGQRVNTTVAPQALLLMNNPHVRDNAMAFASRVMEEASGPAGAVQRAYLLSLGRKPAPQEIRDALDFLTSQSRSYSSVGGENAERLAMADFCQTLFSLNEFMYVE